MIIPTKVITEITADGWTTKVLGKDGEIMSERTHAMKSRGHAAATKRGDVFDDIGEDYEDLAEHIDDNSPFGIAGELLLIRDPI